MYYNKLLINIVNVNSETLTQCFTDAVLLSKKGQGKKVRNEKQDLELRLGSQNHEISRHLLLQLGQTSRKLKNLTLS